MSRRGIVISAGLHAAAIIAASLSLGVAAGRPEPPPPVVLPVEFLTVAEPPSMASQLPRPEPMMQPLAAVEAPKVQIALSDAPPAVEVDPPAPEAEDQDATPADADASPPQEAAENSPTPPTQQAEDAAPTGLDASGEVHAPAALDTAETPSSAPDANEAAQATELAAKRQRLAQEVTDLINGLPDGIGVRRQGQKLSLDIMGDVLFEFDSAELKTDARMLIDQVAGELAKHADSTIEVDGYTDTVGPADYNQHLSETRAESVASELKNSGIDPSRIRTRGFGASALAVPTPGGVPEARNRRVEIVVDPHDGSARTIYSVP